MVTVVTFCLTVTFPCFIFISILIRPPEKTFYPLTAHTTRLLMVADLRLLSKYIERYTINYYGPLLCWDQPNFISLSWIKLIFVDLVQFIIQMLFLHSIGGINIIVKFVYLILTGSSILSSFLIMYNKCTSNLKENNLEEVKNFIHPINDSFGITDFRTHVSVIRHHLKRVLSKKIKFFGQNMFIIGQNFVANNHEVLAQNDNSNGDEIPSRISESSIVSQIQEDSSMS